MGERKGQNKYYPPDFDPAKHGNLNRYHGTHALRERASKLHLGILRIRFEMPYNIWCMGCKKHVAMGVRYNADKKKVGMYYSTPVYEFRMKCHLCDNYFVIRTDPENFDYTAVEGCERQERRWDTEEYGDSSHDRAHTAKLESDAMYKLEHKKDDKDKKDALHPHMDDLERLQGRMDDDYGANSYMRRTFRTEKKEIQEKAASNKEFLKRTQLLDSGIELVAESEEDKRHAKLLALKMGQDSSERRQVARDQLGAESIFDRPSTSHSSSSSSAAGALRQRLSTAARAGEPAAKRHRCNSRPLVVVKKGAKCGDRPAAEKEDCGQTAESKCDAAVSDSAELIAKSEPNDDSVAAAGDCGDDAKCEPVLNMSSGSLVADYGGSSGSDNE